MQKSNFINNIRISIIAIILSCISYNPTLAITKYNPVDNTHIIDGTLYVDSIKSQDLNKIQTASPEIIRAKLVGDGSSLTSLIFGGNGWKSNFSTIDLEDSSSDVAIGTDTQNGKLHIFGGDFFVLNNPQPRSLKISTNNTSSLLSFAGINEFTNITELGAPLNNEFVLNSAKDMDFSYKFYGILNGFDWQFFNTRKMAFDSNQNRLILDSGTSPPAASNFAVKFQVLGNATATRFFGDGFNISGLPAKPKPTGISVNCQVRDFPATCDADQVCMSAFQITNGLSASCSAISSGLSRQCCKKLN